MARVTSRAQLAATKARRRLRLLVGVVLAAIILMLTTVAPQKSRPQSSQALGGEDSALAEPAEAQRAEQKASRQELLEEPAGSGGAAEYGTGIFYTTGGENGTPLEKHELLNEPVPEDCHMEEHADYDGPALRWGLSHKLASAAQCCQACKELSKAQADGSRCNVWVYCPSPTGECWSPDICEPWGAVCWAARAPACRRARMLPTAWGAPPQQTLAKLAVTCQLARQRHLRPTARTHAPPGSGRMSLNGTTRPASAGSSTRTGGTA
ncbi:hypothetical protein ABPG77_002116 [Micractinium sp. CCAP 211/92]